MANPITEIRHDTLHSTLRCLGKAGATTDDADWLRRSGNAELLVRFMRQQQGGSQSSGRTSLRVYVQPDSEISFKGRIVAGDYDRIFEYPSAVPDQDKRWVNTGYSVDIELISGLSPKMRRDHYFSPEDACNQLEEMGYRSVMIPEFLALGSQYPNEQKKYMIVCSGEEAEYDVSHRGRLSLRHGGRNGTRALSIDSVDNLFWDRETRFAAVKIAPTRRRSR